MPNGTADTNCGSWTTSSLGVVGCKKEHRPGLARKTEEGRRSARVPCDVQPAADEPLRVVVDPEAIRLEGRAHLVGREQRELVHLARAIRAPVIDDVVVEVDSGHPPIDLRARVSLDTNV